MKNFTCAFCLCIILGLSNFTNAQVGINTTEPKSSLDIHVLDPSNPTNLDGILVPRLNAFPTTDPGPDQNAMLVFLTQDIVGYFKGFHYWDEPRKDWIPFATEEWKDGTNASGDNLIYAIQAKNAGTPIVITDDGRIGFGTENPIERFEFRGPGDNDFQITSANTNPPNFILYNTGGTLDAPAALAANGEIGSFIVKTHDGDDVVETGGFRFYMDGVATPGSAPSRFVINTTPFGSTNQVERIIVRSNGNVGIGTNTPSERLDINGNVRVRNLTKGSVVSDSNGNLSIGPETFALGKVNGDGTTAKISGATVTKTATGVYNIEFLNPINNADYIIQLTVKRCSACGATDDSLTAYYTNQTINGFTVNIGYNDNGTTPLGATDYEFMFTAIDF